MKTDPKLVLYATRLAAGLLMLDDMILRNELSRRKKQVTYLIDMINKNGGVTDEFDKLALIQLGLTVSPEEGKEV